MSGQQSLLELVLLAATFSAGHAAMPNHWLPFVLVGHAEGWDRRRTLGVAALASSGHVLGTLVVGLLAAALGKWMLDHLPDAGRLSFSAGVLVTMGLIYLGLGVSGRGNSHLLCRDDEDHEHCESPSSRLRKAGDRGPVIGLMLMLTFSPCWALTPVFVAASPLGWWDITILSAVMAAVTVGTMLALTAIAAYGLGHLRFRWLDRHMFTVTGALMVALAVLSIVLHSDAHQP